MSLWRAPTSFCCCARHPNVEILGECGTALEGLSAIRTHKPELIFLDVRMPEYDGFDILEMLGGDAPPAVVFVTAYDQYALKAFEAGALDYLLKPFNNARFERSLDRAIERIALRKDKPARLDRVTIKNAGHVLFLPAGRHRLDRSCRLLRLPARGPEDPTCSAAA